MQVSSGNTYNKQLIGLRGGLDFSSEALQAPAGSLSECLNFETVDYTGYKRIDGFERYDGLTSPSSALTAAVVQMVGNALSLGEANGVRPGDAVVDSTGKLLGYIVRAGVIDDLLYTVSAYIAETFVGAVAGAGALTIVASNADVLISTPTITTPTVSIADSLTVVDLQDLRDSYEDIRDDKRKFSQSRTAHGLHYYKERAYAVVDFESVLVRQLPASTVGQLDAGVVVPGDYLVPADLSWKIEVLDVQVVSGSWGVGGTDATATLEAKILYRRVDAAEGATLFATNDLLGVQRNGSTINSVVQVRSSLSTAARDTWQAGLYRTQLASEADRTDDESYGYWEPITHPWEFEYKDGRVTTGLPPTELVKKYRLESFTEEDAPTSVVDAAAATVNQGGGSGDGFYTSSVANLATDDGTYAHVAANSEGALSVSARADLLDFDLSEIPDDAIITGVSVKIVSRINPTTLASFPALITFKPYISRLTLNGGPVVGENKGGTGVTINSGSEQTNIFGGTYDKWGMTDLGTIHTRESTFGIKIWFARGAVAVGTAGLDIVDIDQIVMTVYYTQPSTKYYFWNGTNDVSADVIKVHTAKGKWDDDADRPEGTMIVTNVTPVGSATRNHISINDQMRTAAANGGDLIAVVGSNMVVCGLASLSQIVETKSRYQIITANYYGDEAWRAMYGVNGAGRGFSYDGTYFQKMFTGAPIDKDKPRHIRSYKSLAGTNGSLALGFPSGSVICSVPGEPENYDGANGAVEISVGSPVVGLANMQGTTLGIFSLDGIYGIKGLGTASELISLKPKAGAIEYTVQEVGNDVMYCDVYGIHSLSQSDLYGDFVGNPLSARISSWLQPRLQRTSDATQGAEPGIIRCSLVKRAKNQYVTYFEGGWILATTLKPDGAEFTIQRYAFTVDEEEFVYTPIALCSEIDEGGREVILFSHYADYASSTDAINSQDRKRYVFALDKGWGFDGEVIPCHITPYYNFFDGAVFDFKQVQKARIYGLSKGVAEISVLAGKEFEDVSSSNAQDISLDYGTVLETDFKQATALANVAKRGICIRLKFVGSTTKTEPSYVIQSLLLSYTLSRGDI